MIRLLIVAVAIAVAGFFAIYFFIGSLFILGDTKPHGAHISAVFALFGFVGPLIVVCIHFATSTPKRSLRARRIMLRVYAITVLIAFLGMAPQLFWADTRLETAENMLMSAVWCCLCGAPIIAAWLNALGDQRAL